MILLQVVFVDSHGERKIPSTLSESSRAIVGIFLKTKECEKRAGPMGRIAHLSMFGCSLEMFQKESMH